MAESTQMFQNRIETATNADELKQIISQLPKTTFTVRVYELSENYTMSFSQIQKKTAITKSLFYDILNGSRTPQRYQIIQIGIALTATLEEVNELLKLAGHKELYAKNKEDAILIFGIKNKLEDFQIQDLLDDAGCTFKLITK